MIRPFTMLVLLTCASTALAQPEPEAAPEAEPEPQPEPEAQPEPEPEPQPEPEPMAEPEPSKPRTPAPEAAGPGEAPGVLDPLEVSIDLDVIAQYRLSLFEENGESEWFHEFELPRAHGAIGVRYDIAHARLLLEAVRSASEGALIGVAGDSFVMRLREAYAGLVLFEMLTLRGGVVPTFTVEALEDAWDMRAVGPVGLERVGFLSPADLGASARVDLPLGLGWVAVGSYNGEGYPGRELNRGKNTEIAARVHPFAPLAEAARPLGVVLSYAGGSSGTALARSNRLTGGLVWDDERVGAGASASYAMGVEDDGGRESLLLEGFVRGNPVAGLLLAGQVAHWWRDLDAPERDALLTVTGSAGYRIVAPLQILAAVDAFVPSDLADTALPELDDWGFRVIARFDLEGRVK
jgi:hypothetical protein